MAADRAVAGVVGIEAVAAVGIEVAAAVGRATVAVVGRAAAGVVGIAVVAAVDKVAAGVVGIVVVAAADKVAAVAEVVAAEAGDWDWGFPRKTALLLPPHQRPQRTLPRAASVVGAEVGAEVEEVAGIAVAVGPVAVVGIVGAPVVAAEAAQVG